MHNVVYLVMFLDFLDMRGREYLDDAVELDIVVVTSTREFNEISASSRRVVFVHLILQKITSYSDESMSQIHTRINIRIWRRESKREIEGGYLDSERTHGGLESDLRCSSFCIIPHLTSS